ncbi:hypothetical protein TWF694_002803 [Orbilia ellipsospora]|uniref:SET domain-containing protein n=1 Tax=Orbilia ellipsospora TaxID=2528407 RepID=A0AAV9X0L5_9PEZI
MNEVLTNGSRPSPTPSIPASSRTLAPSIDLPNVDTESEIRCFCGYDQDDGFTIQCDKCQHWQHGSCVKINPKNVPDTFICYYCEIRDLHQSDVKRAKDLQSKRIEVEGRKTQAQPKRSAGTSNRKRETNGSGHARSYSESTSLKPQSPKDHATGKNRGRQRPISTQNHTNLPDTSASPDEHSPTGKSPSVERDLASDSEVPPSVYTKEYSPISCNTVVSPEVDSKIKLWTHDAQDRTKSAIAATDSSAPCTPKRYSTSEFHELIPSGHTVRWVSSPEELSSLGLPLIRLVSDTPSKVDQFVIEYVGEIGSKTGYIQDPLNQYQRIRHPKAFVLFHPQLPLYIDARRCGSEARFVRRSCRPNLTFETMIIDSRDLRFALYTNQPIERGTELTIGWEWDSALPFHSLLEGASLEDLAPEQLQKMSTWAEVITTTVGECACADREMCIIARLKGDSPVGKSKKSSKSGTKRRWREMQDSNPSGRDGSPEKHDPESKYKRRSSSTSSHRKSESRDRTPTSLISGDITQSSVITDQNSSAREARKMKETINLIEKLTNPDSSHNRGKRVKRSGQASSTQSALPSVIADPPEKQSKTADDQSSALTVSNGVQNPLLPDAVHPPQSSLKTVQVNGISPPKAKPKTSYVDGGVQTDTDFVARLPTHSLPTSRKMRILAQFRAQSQQREVALKKQLSIVKEEESPPREIKSEPDKDIIMSDADTVSEASSPLKQTILDVKTPNLSPTGSPEMTVDISTTGPQPMSVDSEAPNYRAPFYNSIESESPKKILGLHVQLPLTPLFPNTPTTPALQGTSKPPFPTPSGSAASPSSPFQPQTPSGSVTTTGLPASLPTPPPAPLAITTTAPTARKKMSLSDYSARKKAESAEKDKAVIPANSTLHTILDVETEANGVRTAALVDGAMDVDPPHTFSNVSTNGVNQA